MNNLPDRRYSLKKINIDHIWMILPFSLSFSVLALTPLREGDLWWHLKIGELIARYRIIPSTDVFTVTAYGLPYFHAHSWLSDLLLYYLTYVGGLTALVLCQAGIGLSISGLLFVSCFKRFNNLRIASIFSILGLLGLYPYLNARPQVFSFLFFTLFWFITLHSSNRTRLLWLLPLIMVIWVNMHGAWIMGLVLVWIIFFLNSIRHFFSKNTLIDWKRLNEPVLITLATFINPNGIGVYTHLLENKNHPIIQFYVSEWQPLSVSQVVTLPYLFLVLILLIIIFITKKLPNFEESVLLLIFLALPFFYMRMVPFAIIILIPILAGNTKFISFDYKCVDQRDNIILNKKLPIMNLSLLIVLLVANFYSTPFIRLPLENKVDSNLISDYFPIAAVQFLSEHSPELEEYPYKLSVFSIPEWGGFIIWNLYPNMFIGYDGRIELYPIAVWNDYLDIIQSKENWQSILEKYHYDYLLLSKDRHGLLISEIEKSDWTFLYQDEISVIYYRE
jgi:hypothetical protein